MASDQQDQSRVADENTALRIILEGTATATGERFFEELVVSLARALNTHSAWVTEYLEERRQLLALAFWVEGRMIKNLLLDIAGTPCEAVIESTDMVHFPDNLARLFPQNEAIRDFKAVSYLGAPLLDKSGKIIGNLAVLDTRPMPEDARAKAIFQIFAARASAELRRLKAELSLRKSEEKYRRIIETAGEGFLLMDKDFVITDVNQAFCRLVGYSRSEIIGRTPLKFAEAGFRQFLEINRDSFFSDEHTESEGTVVTRAGHTLPVLIHGNTLRGGEDRIIGNMIFVTDMTQQKRSLSLAAEVQRSFLPRESPRVDGLDLAGRTLSCDEIGGDYFDFLYGHDCPQDQLSVVVGDVAGHGVEAALLMTTARALLRMRASQCGSISSIVTGMNRHMARDITDSGRFMTLSLMRFDAESAALQWVRAGHPPALIYDPASNGFQELKGKGVPLGVDGDYDFREYRHTGLVPGQVILIGTDGIWEATDRGGREYGRKRFRDVVRRYAAACAGDILEAVYRDIREFTLGARPQDDITLVVVKVTPRTSRVPDWVI
jgi:PAS domain S-box-containing protein